MRERSFSIGESEGETGRWMAPAAGCMNGAVVMAVSLAGRVADFLEAGMAGDDLPLSKTRAGYGSTPFFCNTLVSDPHGIHRRREVQGWAPRGS